MSTWTGTSITDDGVLGIAGYDAPPLPFEALYPNAIGDEASDDFGPLRLTYGDPEDALSVYLHGLGGMLKEVDDISKDGPNGEPGWSQIFDLSRAKTEWLPWIGQLVGYAVPPQSDRQTLEEYDQTQRERIITRSAYRRGTTSMLYEIVAEHLGGSRRVIIQERYGGDGWLIKVWVFAAEIRTSLPEIKRAALAQKVAGLLMEFSVLPPTGNYDTLRATNANYAEVLASHPNYESVIISPEL